MAEEEQGGFVKEMRWNMTIQDVIDGFTENAEENPERDAYADTLFQEAIRIGMELNSQYHTPEKNP